jgi:hypothetical protein
MKLKYTFETMQLDDKIVAVPVGQGAQDFRAAIRLNDSAAEIFDLLQEDVTEDDIISVMIRRHGDDPDKVTEYVHEFIKGLKKEAVLE